MVVKYALLALLAVGCEPTEIASRGLVSTGCACPADAAVDASPDASTAIDLTMPWTRTVVSPGAATGHFRGADGVAVDPEGCWVTAWEEGNAVTRACFTGSAWSTELVATGLSAVEDARGADLDADGTVDVVSCGADRCHITFRGTPNVTVQLTNSIGHGNALQVALADLSAPADGRLDIVVGTRAGTAANPAEIAWYENPGGAGARTGAAWPRSRISLAGWTMSVVVVGDRVVVSDRSSYKDAGGVTRWDLYGARWLERVGGVWVNHPISAPAGACPVADPMCTTKTPGDEMFLRVVGNEVYDCTSVGSKTDSRITIHHTADWLTWTHTVLPPVANVAHCQGNAVGDFDADGLTDIAISGWKGNALPLSPIDAAKSGVYWLRNTGAGYVRGEISGADGGKFDNVERDGACLITTEQLDPAGGLGVVRYCPP